MILAGMDVSRETVERLEEFAALVQQWTQRINLVASADVPHLWQRHIEDSLQLAEVAENPGPNWLDIGSGGGFPGLVLAIYHKERRPDARHSLIESDARKSAFLLTANRQLDLSATILTSRSESTTPQQADVVTARALAPLPALLKQVYRHMDPTGQAILPKGAQADKELTDARKMWNFRSTSHQSQTHPQAKIIRITGLEHD